MEFILTLSLLLLVFSVVLVSVHERLDHVRKARTRLLAEQLADNVAVNINAVYLAGPGSSTTIQLPSSLKDGTLYLLSLTAGFAEIEWLSSDSVLRYQAPLLVLVTGNTTAIKDDIVLSGNGTTVLVIPTENSTSCEQSCTTAGFAAGSCQENQAMCMSLGNTHLDEGSPFCIPSAKKSCCCQP